MSMGELWMKIPTSVFVGFLICSVCICTYLLKPSKKSTLKDFQDFGEDAEEAFALYQKWEAETLTDEERKRFDELQTKYWDYIAI